MDLDTAKALGRRKAVPVVLELMLSRDFVTVWSAACVLERLGGRMAFNGCKRILTSEASDEARESAAYVLHWLRDLRGVWPLADVVADTADVPRVRAQAAESLGALLTFSDRRTREYKRAAAVLIAALRDPSPEVRFWAAYGLGTMRCRGALEELDRLVASDHAVCPGWWKVAEEAEDAAFTIRTGNPPDVERTRQPVEK